MSLDTFEQALLGELRQHIAASNAAQSTRRRRWTAPVVVGGLATAAATAIAITLGASVVGPPPAYAVDSEPNGDVRVTVYHLADARGLEYALAAKGIHADVTYMSNSSQPDGSARSTSGDAGAACDIALAKVEGGLRFSLGAAQIANGSRLHIVTSGSSPTDVGSPVEVSWVGGPC